MRWWTHEQLLVCSVFTKCTNSYENQTPSSHNDVWDVHLWWWSIHLLTCPQTQYESLHQVHGGVVLAWIEKVATGRPCLPTGLFTMPHKVENLILTEKFSATTLSLTSCCLIPQFAIPLIKCEAELSERQTKLLEMPKMNWRLG